MKLIALAIVLAPYLYYTYLRVKGEKVSDILECFIFGSLLLAGLVLWFTAIAGLFIL